MNYQMDFDQISTKLMLSLSSEVEGGKQDLVGHSVPWNAC